MAGVSDVADRVGATRSLPELLCAACEAFEVMLTVIRDHDQPRGELFVPTVMAGAAAGNGRDHVLFAPSLPPRLSRPDGAGQDGGPAMTSQEAVSWLARVSRVLVAQLHGAAGSAVLAGYREASLGAAGCAREVLALIGGGSW